MYAKLKDVLNEPQICKSTAVVRLLLFVVTVLDSCTFYGGKGPRKLSPGPVCQRASKGSQTTSEQIRQVSVNFFFLNFVVLVTGG